MALLKHEPTGKIYPYNPDLAKREDMVAYKPEEEAAVEEDKKPTPRKRPAPKKEVNDDLDLGDL